MSGKTAWLAAAAVMGVGMALLYPNLIAAVADISHPNWRSSSLGAYRYWRDTGYALGALVLGAIAQVAGLIAPAFWFTAALLAASAAWMAALAACRELTAASRGCAVPPSTADLAALALSSASIAWTAAACASTEA